MGQWDDSADIKHASQTPYFSVFTFHLSLIKASQKLLFLLLSLSLYHYARPSRYQQKKGCPKTTFLHVSLVVVYALKSSTSEASLSSIYEAASVIFFAAYFTKILAGAIYSSASAAWRRTICEMMI